MEPDNKTKRAIIESLIAQIEQQRYTHEVMGQTWQTIGDSEAAKKCATAMAENVKAIAELNKKLEALPECPINQ